MIPMRAWPWVIAVFAAAGCDNMQHQENLRAYQPTTFFADGASARTPPAHTISRDYPAPDDPIAHGLLHGAWATRIPLPVTRAFVERGGQRYAIYCAECHGADGYGRGIVVRRGFPAPPSFHGPRERGEPDGRIFEVISHGQGVMYGYADRIIPADRWAIVAYMRALQKSQDATVADLPPVERERLRVQ
jgi:mono/diheme cytochrome c family protein